VEMKSKTYSATFSHLTNSKNFSNETRRDRALKLSALQAFEKHQLLQHQVTYQHKLANAVLRATTLN